ncbi:MAG: hypothetical protein QOF83_1085 [Solirubrobacteraceae bacterium]|jgi:hypothetical protein|nr:hypothetical protein [Solirubrobacteraceae bacterium]
MADTSPYEPGVRVPDGAGEDPLGFLDGLSTMRYSSRAAAASRCVGRRPAPPYLHELYDNQPLESGPELSDDELVLLGLETATSLTTTQSGRSVAVVATLLSRQPRRIMCSNAGGGFGGPAETGPRNLVRSEPYGAELNVCPESTATWPGFWSCWTVTASEPLQDAPLGSVAVNEIT